MSGNIIAIDGPAGSGKSTIARALAERLGWTYLDTGAMYRAVTVLAIRDHLDLDDDNQVGELAERVTIILDAGVTVNGEDVTNVIRTPEVNLGVSHVAQLPRVREAMVVRQRELAHLADAGVIVEGRDIATVVFPEAPLKVYLTASLAERAKRRGGDEDVASIVRRDDIDANRDASPLRQADDAVVVDTTGLTPDEVVEEILKWQPNNQ